VEPHGQSPCLHAEVRFGTQAWHLTNARAGRHPPPDVGTGRPRVGAFILPRLNREGLSAAGVNPVRNSSRSSNPGGIILGPNPAAGGTAKQRGIISNGVKEITSSNAFFL